MINVSCLRYLAKILSPSSFFILLVGCKMLINPFKTDQERGVIGERLAVLSRMSQHKINSEDIITDYIAPVAKRNSIWTTFYSNSRHHLKNISFKKTKDWQKVWSVNIGTKLTADTPTQSLPVIAGSNVFIMGKNYSVYALSIITGKIIWCYKDVNANIQSVKYGGGLSLGSGKLIMTTGYGDVIGIDLLSGKEIWRQELRVPIRSAAAIIRDLAIIQSLDSQAFAFNLHNGKGIWHHAGINEITSVVNKTGAAANEQFVVLAYNSGEIATLEQSEGKLIWNEMLTSTLHTSEITQINTIGSSPILLDQHVLITGYNNQMILFDLNNGHQIWSQKIGSLSIPLVSSNNIFVLASDGLIYALDRFTGDIRWIKNPNLLLNLHLSNKVSNSMFLLRWSAPIMVNSLLMLYSDKGDILEIAPDTGQIVNHYKMDVGSVYPPVIVNDYLFILSVDGTLVAYH